ncbi:MAG: hypothetical protein KAT46_00095 [Deltaproteobacteria bacterium]|nr:hypothetical protein [Deltaproteobacteria bacterium]
MRFLVVGDNFTEAILKEILVLTERATLRFKELLYSEENKAILIPIERFNIKKQESYLGKLIPYRLDRSKRIKSRVIIRNVEECVIENNFDTTAPEYLTIKKIELQSGIRIEGKDVFLRSCEETDGVSSFVVHLKIGELSLEMYDE